MEKSKIDGVKLTKMDKRVIHTLTSITLGEQKRSTKTSQEDIGKLSGCSENTVARSIKKLKVAGLITYVKPKFPKTPYFINIAKDFYKQVGNIYLEEKNLMAQTGESTKFGGTRVIKTSFNKINTEIDKNSVQFFITSEISKIDLHGLHELIGLTYSDLEFIKTKAGWRPEDIQNSVANYALALETKTFVPVKSDPRTIFISILSGGKTNPPKLFGKPSSLVRIESQKMEIEAAKSKEIENQSRQEQEKDKIKNAQENYWLSLSGNQKKAYLEKTKNCLDKAIQLANDSILTDHPEFNINQLLKVLEANEQSINKLMVIKSDEKNDIEVDAVLSLLSIERLGKNNKITTQKAQFIEADFSLEETKKLSETSNLKKISTFNHFNKVATFGKTQNNIKTSLVTFKVHNEKSLCCQIEELVDSKDLKILEKEIGISISILSEMHSKEGKSLKEIKDWTKRMAQLLI